MSKDNGGPAFPTVDANREEDYGTRGMTLRDYFAAMAMQGLTANAFKYMAEAEAHAPGNHRPPGSGVIGRRRTLDTDAAYATSRRTPAANADPSAED